MGLIGVALALTFFAVNLQTPESAQCFGDYVVISNIGKPMPSVKDGDGYLLVLSKKDGKVVKKIKGLNAPKGIAKFRNFLFVADIDEVVVVDWKNLKVVKRIKIPGAKFLNDVCAGKQKVYVSDTQTNTIYSIDGKTLKVEVFLKSDRLSAPNGLFYKDGTLFVVTWGSGEVLSIGKDKKVRVIARLSGKLDGIVITDDGRIVVSDFAGGRIFVLKNGKIVKVITNFLTPADIGYCNGELFVPEFSGNVVKRIVLK